MKKFIFLFLMILCTETSNVRAGVISGVHFTGGGKAVDLSGLEWMTLSDTVGLSRNAVQSNLDVSFYGAGWRFAKRAKGAMPA